MCCRLLHSSRLPATSPVYIVCAPALNAYESCRPVQRGRFMTEMFRAISFGAMLVASTPALSQAPVLTFGLIGDLGYGPAEEPLLQNVLDDLNSNVLTFVVHVGDLSSTAYACTDDAVTRRFAQFNASAHPLIYIPGDNEWTDCHEKQGIKGGNPLERLDHLRKTFFAGEESLGRRTMRVIRQSQSPQPVLQKYRENVRWTAGGVTFVTLHVTGMPILPSIENFTRLETFGSPNHHWVEVRIDRNDPNVFSVRPRIVAANVVKRQ